MAGSRFVGDRAIAVDAVAVALVSIAICVASQRLSFMSVFVPVVLLLRTALFSSLPDSERDTSRLGEVAFYGLCTLLGAFNDWSSVTRHRVYDYTVPTDLPGLSLIPLWMLLYWGLILRFMLSVSHWRRLRLGPEPEALRLGARRFGGSLARLGVELGLVLATRQIVYRSFAHPLWSWLPFAVGILVALALLDLGWRRVLFMLAVIVIGPLVEALSLPGGGVHRYQLGWFFGVPLWIALWWGLAVTLWQDIGGRLQRACDALARRLVPAQR
jgi:hypothetical protein